MKVDVKLENLPFLEAFSSKTRIQIIEALAEKPHNINELAEAYGLSATIIARHIQKLEKAGIVKCKTMKGVRGIQKMCSLAMESATLTFKSAPSSQNALTFAVPVGQYYGYKATPSCGLASTEKYIGMLDDPRYFSDPAHFEASMLWNACGWVEYRFPNYLLKNQVLKSIEVSFEICSEAPLYNDSWISDISFEFNGIRVGTWTCPGDFGENRGVYTPAWWPEANSKYGLMKSVRVNEVGSYLDGIMISDITISDLKITYGKEILFRISSDEDEKHPGGFNLFGKGFGNYNQDIEVVLGY